jgi:hypothetical protein
MACLAGQHGDLPAMATLMCEQVGKKRPNVAIRLSNLAGLLMETNRLGESEPLMRRALAICEFCYGTNHPEVAIALNNLAGLLKHRLTQADEAPGRSGTAHEAGACH